MFTGLLFSPFYRRRILAVDKDLNIHAVVVQQIEHGLNAASLIFCMSPAGEYMRTRASSSDIFTALISASARSFDFFGHTDICLIASSRDIKTSFPACLPPSMQGGASGLVSRPLDLHLGHSITSPRNICTCMQMQI
jgi:hypothetical protein